MARSDLPLSLFLIESRIMRYVIVTLLLMCMQGVAAQRAFAHAGIEHSPQVQAEYSTSARGPRNWQELYRAWEFDPFVILPLALSAYWYGRGLWRIWREAGFGHGVRRWEAAVFFCGWLALVIALVSPLHAWGAMLFSAHMTQHEVLMLFAAPLLVLGKPIIGILKGLPVGWARDLVRWTSVAWWRAVWRFITNPLAAWLIHAIVLWVWHIPVLFQATLSSDFVHATQHLCFLLSALLFWWAVMQGPHRALNFGVAILYMFTTALHSGALGALITFARSAWYPAYASTAPAWGMSALEDQQLGGIIMWIPACVMYIVAGLALAVGAMRSSEERVRRWESLQVPYAAQREVAS
jgi:putative membrane protein